MSDLNCTIIKTYQVKLSWDEEFVKTTSRKVYGKWLVNDSSYGK